MTKNIALGEYHEIMDDIHEAALEFIAQQIQEQLPPEFRNFLTLMSVLERMTETTLYGAHDYPDIIPVIEEFCANIKSIRDDMLNINTPLH
jgi:hypothetical protein